MSIRVLIFIMAVVLSWHVKAQSLQEPIIVHEDATVQPEGGHPYAPLDKVYVINATGQSVRVMDGKGMVYFTSELKGPVGFTVGGALGKHKVLISGRNGKVTELSFDVDARTNIDDGGRYKEMFDLFYRGMNTQDTGSVTWNGKKYHYYVPWGLDHFHTMKGLKYFLPYGGEFIDLMRSVQRNDGMIYSFVQYQSNVDYFRTRDSLSGYTKKIGDRYFVRQPTENHPEYIYVNTIYQWWKASADDEWMKKNLASAVKALQYSMSDPARWSKRFGLLKRVYTIDSWDFQVDDEYTPDIGMTNSMIIDPSKSKFGVFFGDNTGYIKACLELAEMFDHINDKEQAGKYLQRGAELQNRLDELSWNGHFYRHYIDEDPAVRRNLGVDEATQLAQSNAYTLNRDLSHAKSREIIESYLQLKDHLPPGSPGEWYAIYPPFEKGFEMHDAKWQYMNGGVGGHVAGELARGAFEHGYEKYGMDILERLFELGKRYGNKIWFAYTGAIYPPPPPPVYRTLDLSSYTNMSHLDEALPNVHPWMTSKGKGDDLRKLPVGNQLFNGIKFQVLDPVKNKKGSVVAVSRRKGFTDGVDINVRDTASCIYLLHTSSKPTSENIVGAVTFTYADGSSNTRYILMGKQLTYWWFSELKTDYSGIAWYGDNAVSRGVGLSWCAIDNPYKEKVISKISLHAAQDQTIYTVFAISLANQSHYVPVSPTSFGGPDNWAAATAMAAFVEGVAGVKDGAKTQGFSNPVLSPRWIESRTDTVNVSIRYAASNGYVAYRLFHNEALKQLVVDISGSGEKVNCHFLLPAQIEKPRRITIDGKEAKFSVSKVEMSVYVDFQMDLHGASQVIITY